MSTNEPDAVGPPEYESLILPNFRNSQNYLASIADELTYTELMERASEAGINMSGARSKEDAVERVRDTVRPESISSSEDEG